MHFGIFMEFESCPGRSQTASFREGFDLVEAADAWGLDGVWLGEMHFNPSRSVLGAPIAVAASIATRTGVSVPFVLNAAISWACKINK
jgi:alkanesulfonate monooxygenase SsuD/methylene tetrahydromethanopterin reductase-like flavin-dependent oxidoreductase (luciferase family)